MRFLCAAFLALALLAPSLAWTCSFADESDAQLHEVDPSLQATDQTPPTLTTHDFEFRRQTPDEPSIYETVGCEESLTSCDDLPIYFKVEFGSVQDDQTPPDQIGYLLEIVEGRPPSDLDASFINPEERSFWRDPATQPIRILSRSLRFSTTRDPENPERVNFTLKITPVDLAGNVGAPAFVRVTDPDFPEGCQSVGARSNLPPLLAALALLLAQRAARRLRSAGDSVPRTP